MYVSNNASIMKLNVGGEATFENTVQFNKPIYLDDAVVGGNFQINDGQFMIDETRINIVTLHPSIVDSNTEPPINVLYFANNDMINFSSGSNLIVPGKAGVGVSNVDTYDEQFTIIKRNPNEYQLMLSDKSHEDTETIFPVTNIGHISGLRNVNYIPDKSLIINTNHIEGKLHNMYFYPGVDIVRNNIDSYVPTLTIHQNNKIGINTKTPKKEFDVNGDILCNDIYVRRNNGEITKTLYFISKRYEGAYLGETSRDFYYVYDTTGVSKYAINLANSEGIDMKGLNVGGGIHSVGNGGYYENNSKLSMLKIIDNTSEQNIAYTNEHIIIGYNDDTTNYANKPLTIRNLAREDYNDSIIRIYRAPNFGIINRNALFSGIDICEYDENSFNPDRNLNKWFMYKNHEIQSEDFIGPLQFGYTKNSEHPNDFGMSMYYDQTRTKYHIDINAPTLRVSDDETPASAMTIYGDLDVHGNINIIGNHTYKINGIDVSPTAVQDIDTEDNVADDIQGTSQGINDVVISGNKIAILTNKTLAVGHTDRNFANYLKRLEDVEAYKTSLTVYQNVRSSQVCNFMTFYDTQHSTNSSKMELGLFDTLNTSGSDSTYIDYTGVKKNSVQFKMSNYGQQTENETKSVFDISSYNLQTHQYNKMLSIYHDGSTNYMNIGMQNHGHDVVTDTLGVIDLSNITLHVENPSRYLLQLTNNVREPSINLHRNSGNLNKFWTIEGPDDNENLVFKTSSSLSSYIPDDSTTKTVFTITSNSIGLNTTKPTHSAEIISDMGMSSMKLTNTYSDYVLKEQTLLTLVRNNDLYYNYDTLELDTTSNLYKSGISYKINNIDIPLTADATSNAIIYKFNTNDFTVYDTETIASDLIIEIDNTSMNFTCNNNHLEINSIYSNIENDRIVNSTIGLYQNNINISNILSVLPGIYQTEFCSNIILDSYIDQKINEININPITKDNISYIYEYTFDTSFLNVYTDVIASFKESTLDDIHLNDDNSNILYTSNVFEMQIGDITGDSMIETSYINEVNCIDGIRNIIITSIELHYNSTDEFNVDILSKLTQKYNFENIITAPSSLLLQIPERILTYTKLQPTININADDVTEIIETVYVSSTTDFIDIADLEHIDLSDGGYRIATNQVFHTIGNTNILLNVFVYDNYNLISADNDYQSDVMIKYFDIFTIPYVPHITLQNDVKLSEEDEQSKYGIINKIYSKNGGIEISREDYIYENPILNISDKGDIDMYGDLRIPGNIYANKEEGGLLSVKSLQLYGDIYDRLGNSMLLNYSEDMYNQAFIMQSSNYILYTSNYTINSTSNIDFIIDGTSTEGFSFIRNHPTMNNYDILNINDNDNKVISIVGGYDNSVNIGILKEASIFYGVDIANSMRANTIYSSNIIIEGNLLVRGDVQTFGSTIEWETTSSQTLQSILLSQETDKTYFKIERQSDEYFVQIENTNDDLIMSTPSNTSVFNIDKRGRVNIWKTLLDDDQNTSALNVGGIVQADFFIGDGSDLSDVNLNDKTTNHLAEGTNNLYYTQERVFETVNPLINSTKLALEYKIEILEDNVSNYIQELDDNVSNYIHELDDNVSNYIHELDDNVSNYIYELDDNVSNYIYKLDDNVSNYIYELDDNVSNYVENFVSTTKNDFLNTNYVCFHTIEHTTNITTDYIVKDISDIPYKNNQFDNVIYKLLDISIYSENTDNKAMVYSGSLILSYDKNNLTFQKIDYHTYFSYYFVDSTVNKIELNSNDTITIFGTTLTVNENNLYIYLDKSSSENTVTMTILSK